MLVLTSQQVVCFWQSKSAFAVVAAHIIMVQWALMAALFAFSFSASLFINSTVNHN
jgi:hypothetical protein